MSLEEKLTMLLRQWREKHGGVYYIRDEDGGDSDFHSYRAGRNDALLECIHAVEWLLGEKPQVVAAVGQTHESPSGTEGQDHT